MELPYPNAIIIHTMDRIFILLAPVLFLFASTVHAQSSMLQLEGGGTVDRSQLEWSIAGNLEGHSPNILSELQFRRITLAGAYLKARYTPWKHFTITGSYQQAQVFSGNGTDTDYEEDDSGQPTFNKTFNSNKGMLSDLHLGIGSLIQLNNRISVMPTVEYFRTREKFYLLSNEQQALNSTYQVKMQGADIAIAGTVNCPQLYATLVMGYQLIRYSAVADWNLITIFQHPVSFDQSAKGHGLHLEMLIGKKMTDRVSCVLQGNWRRVMIRKGVDTSYLVSGEEVLTQFNGARGSWYGLRLGVSVGIGKFY